MTSFTDAERRRPQRLLPGEMPPAGKLARISRPKLSGGGRHEGVLLPSGNAIHLTADAGIQACTSDAFGAGHEIQIEAELPAHRHPEARQRLNALVKENKPYHAIKNNCEMFARAVMLEEPVSPQVGFWLVVGIVAGFFIFGGETATA